MQYFLINTNDVVIVVKKRYVSEKNPKPVICRRFALVGPPLKCVKFYACRRTQRPRHVWKDCVERVFNFSSAQCSNGRAPSLTFISLLSFMHIYHTSLRLNGKRRNESHSSSYKFFMCIPFAWCVFCFIFNFFYCATFTVLFACDCSALWCMRCSLVLAINARTKHETGGWRKNATAELRRRIINFPNYWNLYAIHWTAACAWAWA